MSRGRGFWLHLFGTENEVAGFEADKAKREIHCPGLSRVVPSGVGLSVQKRRTETA